MQIFMQNGKSLSMEETWPVVIHKYHDSYIASKTSGKLRKAVVKPVEIVRPQLI